MSLLRDLEYSTKVSAIIREALGEEISDIKQKWELMKLKSMAILYNLQAERLKSLDRFFQILKKKLKQLEQSPHWLFTQDNTSEQIILVQKEIQETVEKKTRGSMLCCKADWHEFGEKSSKYFYNLESHSTIKRVSIGYK